MGPSVCSFCPRPTAISFSRIGRARTSLPPTQKQEKRVEEHRIPCPRDEPSAPFPCHRQLDGHRSHEEVVDHPCGFAGPIFNQAPLRRWLVAQILEEEAPTQ